LPEQLAAQLILGEVMPRELGLKLLFGAAEAVALELLEELFRIFFCGLRVLAVEQVLAD